MSRDTCRRWRGTLEAVWESQSDPEPYSGQRWKNISCYGLYRNKKGIAADELQTERTRLLGELESAVALEGVTFSGPLDIRNEPKLACEPSNWQEKDKLGKTIRNAPCVKCTPGKFFTMCTGFCSICAAGSITNTGSAAGATVCT